jgi:hypothetical protein
MRKSRFTDELDAAHHAVDLVDRGDHDDRDVPELVVALHALEHLIASRSPWAS